MGFLFNKPADAAGSAAPAIIIGLFVAFGGLLFGYVLILYQQSLQHVLMDVSDMTPVPSAVFWP